MPRVSETDVAIAVVKYLNGLPGHTATIQQIKRALPGFLNLTAADRKQSETRPGEELWEQQVRNIVSHRETPGNFINDGRLAHTPRRLTLTAAGQVYAGTL